MNHKLNQELLTILSKGCIENESEFKVFFQAHHEIINEPNTPKESFQLVNIRQHLSGGYCQVQLYENPCHFSNSLFGIYEPDNLPIQIKFYNYNDMEVKSYRKLQEEYITVELEEIKEKYIGLTTTISELASICNYYSKLEEEIGYYAYLEDREIPFGFCVMDDKSVMNVVFEFDVLDDYFLYTAEAWELLKEILIKITGVRLTEFFAT